MAAAAKDATPADYEGHLKEMASAELYGLSPKHSSVGDMQRRLEKGTINLFPSYQRDFVWKSDRASRLIVTLLCNRVLPVIVLHEKKEGRLRCRGRQAAPHVHPLLVQPGNMARQRQAPAAAVAGLRAEGTKRGVRKSERTNDRAPERGSEECI